MKKFLLALVLVLPMMLAGCSNNKDVNNQKNSGVSKEITKPNFISSIKGVNIGATAEQTIDLLKSQGLIVEVSGDGIQFIEVNDKIAFDNFVFDTLTAYAYTDGISNILLKREFYSESSAVVFYNEVDGYFNGKYSHFKSIPNEVQRNAYVECARWTDTKTDLDLYLEQDGGAWNVGLMLSAHN